MKLELVRLVAISCLLVLLTPSDSTSVQERRIALVIGNGAYKSSPLANPVNDANDMAAALKKLGFSVMLKINANQRSMENSIRAFGKELRSSGVGLFYFAGHGLQVHGRNYLIPIGADIESEADVKYESVDAGRVLAQMDEAEHSLNIIILDACRDNPYCRSFRSSERGLTEMDAPSGSILAYSTAPGSVSADGTGRNGLYTSIILKHIFTSGLEIGRLFRKVRIDVMEASGKRQIPWESSSLMGDFYFSSNRGISVISFPENNQKNAESEKLKSITINKPLSSQEYYQLSLESQDITQKIKYLRTVIDIDPSFFQAYKDLGEIYSKTRRFQKAIYMYNRALAIQNSQIINYEIGRLYNIVGKNALAIKHLQTAALKQNYLGKQAARLLQSIK